MDKAFVVERASPAVASNGTLVQHIGIETMGGHFTTILAVGEQTPCTRTEIFSTATDAQDMVSIRLYRGASERLSDAQFLGEFVVVGFPAGPRGIPQLAVSFRVDGGRIELFAVDRKTSEPLIIEPKLAS